MSQAPRAATSATRRWVVLLLLLGASAALVFFSDPPGAGNAPVRAIERKPVAGVVAGSGADEKRTATAVSPKSSGVPNEAQPTARKGAVPGETMILAITPRVAARPDAPRDAFGAQNWNPPPPPPPPAPPPAPPPKPVAPPLPYTFLGKQQQDGRWQVFLGRADRTIIAKVGDVLDSTYRVDTIAPPQMQITYLPLGQQQVLFVGAVQ